LYIIDFIKILISLITVIRCKKPSFSFPEDNALLVFIIFKSVEFIYLSNDCETMSHYSTDLRIGGNGRKKSVRKPKILSIIS